MRLLLHACFPMRPPPGSPPGLMHLRKRYQAIPGGEEASCLGPSQQYNTAPF